MKTLIPMRGMRITMEDYEVQERVADLIRRYGEFEYTIADATAGEISAYNEIKEEQLRNALQNAQRQEFLTPLIAQVLNGAGVDPTDEWWVSEAQWLLRNATPLNSEGVAAQTVRLLKITEKPKPRESFRDIPLDGLGWRGGEYV